MNVPLLFLPLLYLTRIVSGKVAVGDNSAVLPNKIGSREDWYALSKYYASIHKPYNVQKYVPYRPSNQTTVTKRPLNVQPEFTTEAAAHDWDKYSEIDSTTETLRGTAERADVSSLLLSIIGSTPGIETTTSYYESIFVSTEDNHLTSMDENNLLDNAIPSTTSEPEPEPESTTTVRNAETTLFADSTTPFPKSTPSTLDTTIDAFESLPSSSQIEFTTEMEISTTEFPTSTTEMPSTMSTQPETTTITILPDSTTEVPTSTTESTLSTSMQPETTTEVDIIPSIATSQTSAEITSTESPFLLNSTVVVESTTEINSVNETSTSKPIVTTTQRSILVGDIFRPKPRTFTYSSDVMPETDWE